MMVLEEFFDVAMEAPDGIKKLRELILTLAMQGKLVPQDPSDQPASELLKEIEAEKKRLVKEGKIKAPKPLPPIDPDEVPYDLPKGWEWTRLISIGSWVCGCGLPLSLQGGRGQEILLCKVSDMNLPGNEKYIFSSNNTISEKAAQENRLSVSEPGTIIFPKIGGAIATNKRRILTRRTVIDNNCLGFFPYSVIALEWCYQLFQSMDFALFQTGTSVPAISQGIIGQILIGLPPAPEQRRIVVKVEELMARCDELDRLRQERDRLRVAAHSAAVSALQAASDQESLHQVWNFIAEHFGDYYSVKENLAELRKTILQLAMMGKLVPQDPSDQPASELLKEIEAEKKRLVKEGKIKAPKPLPPIDPGEVPYDLPNGWEWVRLGDTSLKIHYGYTASADHEIQNVRLLRITDIQENKVVWESVPGCEIGEKDAVQYLLSDNDILIARTGGTVGKSYLVKGIRLRAVFASYLIRVVSSQNIDVQYIKYFLECPFYWRQLSYKCSGTGQPNVNGASLSGLLVPLSPLPEQHRIVAKVDELMARCDELEKHLDDAVRKKASLLTAMVAAS